MMITLFLAFPSSLSLCFGISTAVILTEGEMELPLLWVSWISWYLVLMHISVALTCPLAVFEQFSLISSEWVISSKKHCKVQDKVYTIPKQRNIFL